MILSLVSFVSLDHLVADKAGSTAQTMLGIHARLAGSRLAF
jgi:hypothetical protein